jgi:hypothetical protein
VEDAGRTASNRIFEFRYFDTRSGKLARIVQAGACPMV